ncbi:dipeptidyl-peptidase 3 family protein [Carboxylicivirga marina]|uniref:Dihydrofolate reductase n=1 Tax=Carboxylicivirga marina TaxID=2800988 RepID=A0ABS1HFH3_9BACT|nr:dihydrofolate reductase [Carboxylicivirga marina]MBK3516387.1 dihydrofolate reductase [Carboxylicivirga marina]
MTDFKHFVEQFADLRILRYQIPGFSELPLKKKLYIYYLSEAGLCGRDIIWDQNCEANLWIRKVLDKLYCVVDSNSDGFGKLEEFYKRVLFANGIHHHYSTDKLQPNFAANELNNWINYLSADDVKELQCDSIQDIVKKTVKLLFDNQYLNKMVCQDEGKDLIINSANNFYKNINQAEAEDFYKSKLEAEDLEPVSYGLNSRLIKSNNKISEETYCINGKYSNSIEKITYCLGKAAEVCENKQQKALINTLCNYYRSGDLTLFDEYSIEWIKEQSGEVDFINGFIEVYGDALGYKGAWESLVNISDKEETEKVSIISDHAQWFENHSPVLADHKKETVKGVSMKVINAIMLGGDCYPASPLGINLPNSEWIREKHGSKSVSLQNISQAYEMASLTSGVVEEFAFSTEEIKLHKQYGAIADNLHTHLHECLGHGSGKLESGIRSDDLKAYGSVIEEARADLFGLYFMADNKMLELDLVPDMDVYKAQYNSYIRNGLMVQLARVKHGANIEQTHMRNRQLISSWAFKEGAGENVIEHVSKDGKSYFKINDYSKLRKLFGKLLKEVQRIKSQGDYEAARELVEQYGVKVDSTMHKGVLERYAKLKIAPYSGFLNPKLSLLKDDDDSVIDVSIDYSEGFIEQMRRYNREYSFEL